MLHNLPAGDWDAGERGIACLPDRVDEFRAGVARAIEYATALGVPQLNCLAGKAPLGASDALLRKTFVANLKYAAAELKKADLKLLIEPINTYDIPGFYLNRTAQAIAIMDEVGADNLFLQYDIYHAQRIEGELAATMSKHLARIAHVQVADNPGRNEPGSGEINYPFLFAPPRPHRLPRLRRLRVQAGRRAPRPASAGWSMRAGSCARALNLPFETKHRHDLLPAEARLHRPGHHGRADGGAPDQGRPPALRLHPRQGAPGDRREQRDAVHQRARRRRARRHRLHDGAGHAGRGEGAVRETTAWPPASRKGKTVVDMSSISPIETKAFAKRINELGCDYLDAPVSGGEVGAKAASLTIMVGGPRGGVRRACCRCSS